jgi:hypothetical protein
MTVFVCVNTSKQVGDAEHIKVFANIDAVENGPRRTARKARRLSLRFLKEPVRPPRDRVDAAYRDALRQKESRIPPVGRLPQIAAR